MSGDHDLGYKSLLAHPELVRDLLAGFAGLPCFAQLDSGAFERLGASFVGDGHVERHGDMVWRVHLPDQLLYVYLLLEFQSRTERWMALRIQVYVGMLYQDLIKHHALDGRHTLPPVLPVVFYNGRAAWRAPDELRALVGTPPAELEAFQARQRYLLIDQRQLDPAALASSRNIMAALFRLELSPSMDVLVDVLGCLRTWLVAPHQAPLRRSVASWIDRLMRRELPRHPLVESVQEFLEEGAMGDRYARKYATWEDAKDAEILERLTPSVLEKGRAEGRAQAEREADALLRGLLERQLEARFGPLPADAGARIAQAGRALLVNWIERAADAPTLAAVLASQVRPGDAGRC